MSIFRKTSLDRLSSPEELDQLMRVTSVHSWLGLSGMLLLLCMITLWGFKGSLPTSVSGEGAIVREGGVMNVVSRGSGVLLDLKVKVGDRVTRGEVVAHVAQPAMAEKLQLATQAMEQARRERQEFLQLHTNAANLQIEAVGRHIANAEEQIARLQEQAQLASEQIRVQEDLLSKGLVTQQQTIAAKQKLASLQTEIANHQAEIKQFQAQKFEFGSKPLETDAEMRTKISELQRTVTEYEKELELNNSLVSPYAGEVIELKAYPGGIVGADSPVISIQPEANNLEILAYVSSLRAKEIKAGMEAQISPSTVKREEYGYIRGKVLQVADYPATKAALMRNFENESLISALTHEGPMTELKIQMIPDEGTLSGFRWSSSQGPPVLLSSGTLCTIQVVTKRQRPVTLFLPFLKEKMGAS